MTKFWVIIISGFLLRLFLSFATSHPDIQSLITGGQLVFSHPLTFYDYSSNAVVFNYPPLIYWFFGLFTFIFGSISGFLKLPYLFFDILLGLLLYKLVNSRKALVIFGLWIFNPISLYSTYMMGQFDIIPTFFTILSLYFAAKAKLKLASLALGFGIAFKLYPVFLIIPLVLLAQGIWPRIKLVILSLLPYALSVLAYLPSGSFRQTALFANQSSKSLYASIGVSGGEAILLFPFLLIFFYLYIASKGVNKESLWKMYLIPLLLFFTFTHFHPQWFIWVTPFLILELGTNKFKNLLPIFIVIITWFVSLFFFDPSLTVGMFAPLFPFLKNTADIWTLLNLSPDYNFSRSILQTLFASSAVYLIYRQLSKQEND